MCSLAAWKPPKTAPHLAHVQVAGSRSPVGRNPERSTFRQRGSPGDQKEILAVPFGTVRRS